MTSITYCDFLPFYRDLSQMRSDLTRTTRNTHSACLSIEAASRGSETGTALSLERERGEKLQLEAQMREKLRELMEVQARFDAEKADLSSR